MSAEKAPIPPPVVPPERTLDEITLKAIVLGLVLAMLLAAANAYLGLRVGMTVAASIPASAVSLGVLRMFRKSTILENNMVQTVASAGASTVSGVIFTIPALVMMGAWSGYDYWPIFAMVVLGGVMGVAFTVPLRRALIVDVGLQFPEGVATAEVLKTGGVEREKGREEAGDAGVRGFKMLLQASGIGALYKLLDAGFRVLTDTAQASRAFLGGKWLFTIDATLAPSLLGIGFIVGLNIGVLMLIGAVIGTVIGVPVNWWLNHDSVAAAAGIPSATPWYAIAPEQAEALAAASFKQCKGIGVGCMILGGFWSLLSLAKPLVAGIKASISAVKNRAAGSVIDRTERDTPFAYLIIVSAAALVPLYFVFLQALDGYENKGAIAGVMALLMVVFGLLFTSVAGYMAGLVGSSNNPVSGVTMATVIVSSLVLLGLMGKEGIAARVGPAAVIYLAAVICIGACIAGDNLQDLKCGHLVGATPWKQQICLVLGAIGSACVIPLVLGLLDQNPGIGRLAPSLAAAHSDATPLAAPQASLMKEVSTRIFGEGIDWNFILIGFGVAAGLILLDKIQEKRGSSFRFPVLAVAVGIYLNFGLSVLIFLGSVLSWFVMRKVRNASPAARLETENAGLLLSSGLITGEALMGLLVALAVGALQKYRNVEDPLPPAFEYRQTAALVATGLMMVYLYLRTRSAARA